MNPQVITNVRQLPHTCLLYQRHGWGLASPVNDTVRNINPNEAEMKTKWILSRNK